MTPPGQSDSPRNTVERAADAALEAARAALEAEGGEAVKIFICIQASGVPEDDDCTVAGHGYDDGIELLSELLGHASGISKRMGLDFAVAPIQRGGANQ